LTFYIKQGYMT